MILGDLKKNDIKRISKEVAPKLTSHPLFMFFCKDQKKRQEFIEVYFNYYLRKWNNKNSDIVLADDGFNDIISLIELKSYAEKNKGKGLSKLKKYKNPYANVSYHKGNVAYLTSIVAPGNIESRIMTIYSTSKHIEAVNKLVDDAIKLADENKFMIVYETFSKKQIELMKNKGFETAYERQFSGTQFFETVMTYYKHDEKQPAKLIKEFKRVEVPPLTEEEKAESQK